MRIAKILAEDNDPDISTYCSPIYVANNNLKWFDNYEGQRVMVVDEMRWKTLGDQGIPLLLRLLDSQPFRVEVKGGYKNLRAKYIIITSQDDPDTTFQHGIPNSTDRTSLENIGQVIRRITKLFSWTGHVDENTGEYKALYTDVTQ